MQRIGERLDATIKGAKISPRILSSLTKVHYTTIYKLIANPDQQTFPVVQKALTDALDKLDSLIAQKKLPFVDIISDKEKTQRLEIMLASTD